MTVYATDPTQLTDEVMHCRAFGHQWTDTGATPVGKGNARGWRVTQTCGCCGTDKLFDLNRRGELANASYRYPDYYLARFYIGSEERGQFRLQALGLEDR